MVLSTAVSAGQHVELRVLHPGVLWGSQAALASLSYSAQLFATDGTTQKGTAVQLSFHGSHTGTSEGDTLVFQLPLRWVRPAPCAAMRHCSTGSCEWCARPSVRRPDWLSHPPLCFPAASLPRHSRSPRWTPLIS